MSREATRRRIDWRAAYTAPCCWKIYGRQFVGPPNKRRGYLLPGYVCTKTGHMVGGFLQEENPGMHVPPMENPICASFEEYEEVPETVTLEFLEEYVT